MSSGMSDITPTYTDEEVFVMVELQFGAPPMPVTPRHRHDPALDHLVQREVAYYNDVTSFIVALCPHPHEFARVFELRRALYVRHGIMSFDAA
jgi:hypothetical protein